MRYEEFIGQVQNRARLGSQGDAVTAVRATLQTLAERLAGGAANNLAAQLPFEVGEYLREIAQVTGADGERLSIGEFLRRVSEREGKDYRNNPEVVSRVCAVMDVLREAVSRGEFDKVRAQLPEEYEVLFEMDNRRAVTRKKPGRVRKSARAVPARR